MLRRAQHIVQHLKLEDVVAVQQPSPASLNPRLVSDEMAKEFDDKDNLLLMEYMQHGDVKDLIKTAVRHQETTDFRHSWKLFCCRKSMSVGFGVSKSWNSLYFHR